MKEIKPNSFEAVAIFVMYICYQDEEISIEEIDQFESDLDILKRLYLDMNGELIAYDFKKSLKKIISLLEDDKQFLNQKLSPYEINFFNKIITDKKLQNLAMLEAKHAAESDGFHKKEKSKFLQWQKIWV